MIGPDAAVVDLHMHTTASDGTLAPADLIRTCAGAGVALCAVTDHDTVAGLGAATEAAAAEGIRVIPGVELSAAWEGRTIHVVGLGFDPAAAALTALLAEVDGLRRRRAQEIAARLDKLGLPGSGILAHLGASDPRSVVTRTHFARELAGRGVVADPGSAFRRFLARGRPAYVRGTWPELGAVIDALRDGGGVAVLAHPLRYTLSAGQRRRLVADFAHRGGTGLEVVTGGQSREQTEAAAGLCLRAGLEGSVGSDCHDPSLPWQRPGRLAKLPPAIAPIWRRWQADPANPPESSA